MKKKKSRKTEKPYTVEEFLDHFRALLTVRKYEHVSRPFGSPEHVEVGDDQSFEINVIRIMDYFSQVYADEDEARDKSVLFVVILTHIAKYKDSYDSERFAVIAEGDQASMISIPLLKAVHHHFTSASLGELPKEDALVETIKATARKIAETERLKSNS